MSLKELRQLRRDRLTLAMMALLPLVQLVLFGYGCSAPIVATNNNAYLGVVTQSSNCWRLGENTPQSGGYWFYKEPWAIAAGALCCR